MARNRELPPHVIVVKLEEQPPSEPSVGEEEIRQDEEEEDDDEDEEEDEDEDDEDEDEEENNEVQDEEEEDFSSKESIRKLLEPFGKEKLMEIFKEAVVKNPSLLSRIVNEAEAKIDPVHRTIHVYGIDWDATSENLAAAFSPFGQIENCRVIMNQHTGRCKGYGFVVFRTRAAAKRALKDPLKVIGDRAAKCELAFLGAAGAGPASGLATAIGRNFRVGLLNPVAGLSPALSGRVAGISHQPCTVGGAGIPPESYAVRPVGSASRASVVSVNSISPSVIGNYGSLAAVHGLGAYQNSAPSAATRPQSGIGSWGASRLAPFYGQ